MNARVDFSSIPMARHALTVDLYYRMAETGILPPDARVELIEGEVVDMSPIGVSHAGYQELIADCVRRAVDRNAMGQLVVRTQLPIRLSELSEPQPDIAVLYGSLSTFLTHHPEASEVALVIEISESSRSYDRSVKASLYAAHGIAEYWIVDLVTLSIERRSQPIKGEYKTMDRFGRSEACQSLSLPWLWVCLGDLG